MKGSTKAEEETAPAEEKTVSEADISKGLEAEDAMGRASFTIMSRGENDKPSPKTTGEEKCQPTTSNKDEKELTIEEKIDREREYLNKRLSKAKTEEGKAEVQKFLDLMNKNPEVFAELLSIKRQSNTNGKQYRVLCYWAGAEEACKWEEFASKSDKHKQIALKFLNLPSKESGGYYNFDSMHEYMEYAAQSDRNEALTEKYNLKRNDNGLFARLFTPDELDKIHTFTHLSPKQAETFDKYENIHDNKGNFVYNLDELKKLTKLALKSPKHAELTDKFTGMKDSEGGVLYYMADDVEKLVNISSKSDKNEKLVDKYNNIKYKDQSVYSADEIITLVNLANKDNETEQIIDSLTSINDSDGYPVCSAKDIEKLVNLISKNDETANDIKNDIEQKSQDIIKKYLPEETDYAGKEAPKEGKVKNSISSAILNTISKFANSSVTPYPLAGKLLNLALNKSGLTPGEHDGYKVITNHEYKKILSGLKINTQNEKDFKTVIFNEDSKYSKIAENSKSLKESIIYNAILGQRKKFGCVFNSDRDMMLAINGGNVILSGISDGENGTYNIKGYVSDIYDFDSSYTNNDGNKLNNILNRIGYRAQRNNTLEKYRVLIPFNISVDLKSKCSDEKIEEFKKNME